LRRPAVVPERIFAETNHSPEKFKTMKQLFFTSQLLLSITIISKAQSTYSRYNGKTWEQINGSGKLVQLNPLVEQFTKIEISQMNVQVRIETGAEEYSLSLSIDDNLKDFFRYKQEGNTLKISFDLSGGKYNRWLSSNNTVVTIKVPELESLSNSGNTNIELTEINQKTFSLVTTGNPDITLSGIVNEFTLQSTGNSDINAGALVANKILLSSSGNSDIVVNAKELVEEKMNGNNEVSNLYYKPATKPTVNKTDAIEYVSFKLRNNSLLPSKVSVISYRPDESGNGTNAFVMMPYGTRTYRFPVGTKIYLADQKQVNTVMSGARISDQAPFLLIKKQDNNKTFNINQ
jgi:hypothetical protein